MGLLDDRVTARLPTRAIQLGSLRQLHSNRFPIILSETSHSKQLEDVKECKRGHETRRPSAKFVQEDGSRQPVSQKSRGGSIFTHANALDRASTMATFIRMLHNIVSKNRVCLPTAYSGSSKHDKRRLVKFSDLSWNFLGKIQGTLRLTNLRFRYAQLKLQFRNPSQSGTNEDVDTSNTIPSLKKFCQSWQTCLLYIIRMCFTAVCTIRTEARKKQC